MDIVLFDPQWTIARLKDQVPVLKQVSGAADLPTAIEQLKQPPAAYVIPLAERAAPNALATEAISQECATRFAVVLATQNLRDVRGEAAQATLLPIRKAVFEALLGWVPAADFNPCEFGGGRLVQLNDMVLW